MKKGFTLVELLAVVIIMGIIGSLILLNVSNILDRSAIKTANESIKGLFNSIELLNSTDKRLANNECKNINSIKLENDNIITSGEFCMINNETFLKHVKVNNIIYSGTEKDFVNYEEGEKHLVTFKLDSSYNVPDIIMILDDKEQLQNRIIDYIDNDASSDNIYKMWESNDDEIPSFEIAPMVVTKDLIIDNDYIS